MCDVFSLQECEEQLEREIHLEFSRTMNQMCFDKVVQENPEEFSYIKVPLKEPERVPKRGQLLMGMVREKDFIKVGGEKKFLKGQFIQEVI